MAFVDIRPTISSLPAVRHLLDGVIVCLTLPLVQTALGKEVDERTWVAGLMGALLFFVIGEACGLYRTSKARTPDLELAAAMLSWIATFGALGIIGFLTRATDSIPRSSMVAWFVLGGLVLNLGRMCFRALLEQLARQGFGTRRCAIAGLNPLGLQVAQNAMQQPECGLRVIGFYDDRGEKRQAMLAENNPPFLGGLDAMIEAARKGEIDTVLVTLPMRAEQRIRSILTSLGDTTAAVYIVPDFFVFELLHSRWAQVGGLPVVSVFETPVYGVDGWIKRSIDLALASVALVLLTPVMITIGLLIKITSPGPIFFRQKRYGLAGNEILVWKFRSMKVCENGPVVTQATKNDPRVTPLGSFLRRTSLDEIPQLINVIEGTMSLVGPRPHATAHNEHFRRLIPGYMLRHKVRPGITGLAQVEGSRGETDTVEKMEARISLDHRYIREWSIWLDIKILFRTIWVVLKHEAY